MDTARRIFTFALHQCSKTPSLVSFRVPSSTGITGAPIHWSRLVKNIGWANQNIGGQKVVKSDKCMGFSQLLGARARAVPQSLRLCSISNAPLALLTVSSQLP